MDPRPPHPNPFDGIDEDLAALDDLSVSDQVPVFTRIHSRLTNALATTAGSADGQPLQAHQPSNSHPNNPRPNHSQPNHQQSGHRPQPGRR